MLRSRSSARSQRPYKQTSQFAPTLRKPGFPDGSDLQYMLYTILQRYRFFVDATRDAAQNKFVPQTGAVGRCRLTPC